MCRWFDSAPGRQGCTAPNRSRLGVLFLGSPKLCGTPAGSACVDERVQFGYPARLSLDFALCSQKRTKELFKSTHVQWSGNRSIALVSTRSVCSIRNSVRKPKQIVLCPSICQNTTECKTSSSAQRFQTPQFAKWLAFEVNCCHDSPFDRLVWPDALWATGRLRAALSFLEMAF